MQPRSSYRWHQYEIRAVPEKGGDPLWSDATSWSNRMKRRAYAGDEHQTIKEVEAKFERDLQTLKHEMLAEMEKQQNEFAKEIKHLKEERASVNKPAPSRKARTPPTNTYVYSVYGCDFDMLTLDCPSNRTLIVTSAYYAQFSTQCGALECCNPHPTDDCAELMETNAEADWIQLTQACNYNNNCTFENKGGLVASCAAPYDADYMIVYYECFPLPDITAVGFTARDESGSDHHYEREEIIQFRYALTNIGSNFQTQSSTFICPVDGMYTFSLTLHNDQDTFTDQNFEADLMQEGNHLVTLFINYEDHHQSTVNAVVECRKGERVWAQCNVDDGCTLRNFDDYYYNSFSGYLIYAY